MEDNKKIIARRKFMRIAGSVIAGGTILGVTANLVRKMVVEPDKLFFGADDNTASPKTGAAAPTLTSPYKLISAFDVKNPIKAFDVCGNKLVVATDKNLLIYDSLGKLLNTTALTSEIRYIAAHDDLIYALCPTKIEVYNIEGKLVRDWNACDNNADYCALTIAGDLVFVTDAANKNICKYTNDGRFLKFINSPNGFIIPSYSFGIEHIDGIIYCSNSGRHLIESYSLDGDYLGSFGKTGNQPGAFCGCCNPVHLSATANGEIITSEKGQPRISCYGKDGEFHGILLDSKALGGGNAAYNVKVLDSKLVVSGSNSIKTFAYSPGTAQQSNCTKCQKDCPLKKGVTIP